MSTAVASRTRMPDGFEAPNCEGGSASASKTPAALPYFVQVPLGGPSCGQFLFLLDIPRGSHLRMTSDPMIDSVLNSTRST